MRESRTVKVEPLIAPPDDAEKEPLTEVPPPSLIVAPDDASQSMSLVVAVERDGGTG